MASMQLQAGVATANVLVTTNKILNYTMSLIGNIITLLFYIVFSPFICLLMLIYPTKEQGEQGEPEELRRLSMVSVAEEEDDENPFQQSEESKELQRKIKKIRF